MVRYVETRPRSPVLAKHVKCLWALIGEGAAGRELVTPDGHMEIVIHVAGPIVRATADAPARSRCVVVGQMLGPIELDLPAVVRTFGVRFRPAGAAHFLRVPAHELRGQTLPVRECWGNAGEQLQGRLAGAEGTADCLRVLEQSLLAHYTPRRTDPTAQECLALIRAADGAVSVSALARITGRSVRTVQRRFRETVGLTPKQYARITRFRSVLARLDARRAPGWAEVAANGGYADQSHLIRDFQQFSGQPPAAFARSAHGLNRQLLTADA